MITEKGPLWWLVFLALTLVIPLLSGNQRILTISSTFAIYASVNLMWMLVFGTAGILSLASLAITGIGAYTAAWLSTHHDLPWPLFFVVGGIAGLIVGVIISIPARRMSGMYYALLTLGIAEVCRAYALQADWLDAVAQGSISGAGGFIPEDMRFTARRPADRLHRRLHPAARGARGVPARQRAAARTAAARLAP